MQKEDSAKQPQRLKNESEQETQLFKCDKCGATFKDADALEKHRRVHEHRDSGKPPEQDAEPSLASPRVPPTGPSPIPNLPFGPEPNPQPPTNTV
jgi:hypothetical protein